MVQQTLYERLGGVFAIAAVVDKFSDAVVKNPIVGQQSQNPQLREHTKSLDRLPGLKFMRDEAVEVSHANAGVETRNDVSGVAHLYPQGKRSKLGMPSGTTW